MAADWHELTEILIRGAGPAGYGHTTVHCQNSHTYQTCTT